jgi:hypothetical protein
MAAIMLSFDDDVFVVTTVVGLRSDDIRRCADGANDEIIGADDAVTATNDNN